MNVKHNTRNAKGIETDNVIQLLGLMFETADHAGIAQFRSGSITVTVLDTAVSITFSSR